MSFPTSIERESMHEFACFEIMGGEYNFETDPPIDLNSAGKPLKIYPFSWFKPRVAGQGSNPTPLVDPATPYITHTTDSDGLVRTGYDFSACRPETVNWQLMHNTIFWRNNRCDSWSRIKILEVLSTSPYRYRYEIQVFDRRLYEHTPMPCSFNWEMRSSLGTTLATWTTTESTFLRWPNNTSGIPNQNPNNTALVPNAVYGPFIWPDDGNTSEVLTAFSFNKTLKSQFDGS